MCSEDDPVDIPALHISRDDGAALRAAADDAAPAELAVAFALALHLPEFNVGIPPSALNPKPSFHRSPSEEGLDALGGNQLGKSIKEVFSILFLGIN